MARPLRVVALVSQPLPVEGGGLITVVTLLAGLVREFGCAATVIGIGPPGTARRGGVVVRSLPDQQALQQALVSARPDLLLSTHDQTVLAAAFAERYDLPHVVWAQSFELCPPTITERHAWSVSLERVYPSLAARRDVLQRATLVLANSRFLAHRLRRVTSRRVSVLPPCIKPTGYQRATRVPPGDAVVGICGHGYKGADLFLGLAARRPEQPFLLAGHIVEPWRRRAAALTNVTVVPYGHARTFLRRARVVVVPSQWPEPFGRIAVEAMLAGVPVIASRTGGLPEACGDAAWLVQRFRSLDAWTSALDAVLGDATLANAMVARGYAQARRQTTRPMVATAYRLFRRVAGAGARRRWPARTRVVLAGDTQARSAFALINRAWADGAARRPHDVIAADPGVADARVADVHIRNDFSVRFETWTPPPTGRLAAFRTWDFGPYPPEWARAIAAHYDQLWVPSRWLKTQAIAAGIPRQRVRVVPPGVDVRTFRPDGPRRRWPSPRFTFLFVGAPVARKGIDTLLTAYLAAFTARDPVRLVIKAHPDDLFYRDADARADIARALARTDAPEICFIDQFLSPAGLAALYRSADVCVFPYRAEGFGLPIVEAMACGRPTMVPRFGAALDFCSARTSFLLPARRIHAPVGRSFAINTLGFEQHVDAVDFCEVGVDTLAAAMRQAMATGAGTRARMGAAARQSAQRFSWTRSRGIVDAEVRRLMETTVPVRFAATRADARAHARLLATARALYLGR